MNTFKNEELIKKVNKLEDLLKNKDINILEQKEIPYGIQLLLQCKNTWEENTLNIYSGKRGISYVLGRKDVNFNGDLMDIIFEVSHSMDLDFEQCIGTDESGKGDYFGPLVVAGFYMSNDDCRVLDKIGVKDSKCFNDNSVMELYNEITRMFPDKYQITIFAPERYNEMYSRFRLEGKNLNHLLSFGHADVIEKMMHEYKDTRIILSDQFGSSSYLENALFENGRSPKLIQNTRAEENMSVAAASIIARAAFLQWMYETGKSLESKIPKGAGEEAHEFAVWLAEQKGVTSLKQYVKLHFKNTKRVLLDLRKGGIP